MPAGTEIAVSPRLSVNVDFIGRQLVDSGPAGRPGEDVQLDDGGRACSGSTTVNEFAFHKGSLNLLTSAIGFKFNPGGNILISANVLFPITDAGIRSNPVPVIGFDYTF